MWRRDDGQHTVEYVGLVVLIGAIVVALVQLRIGATVAAGIERAVCRIMHTSDDAECGDLAPPAADDQMTPLEKATRGTYVALGDSYSSGEGGTEFMPGTDRDAKTRPGEIAKEVLDDYVPFWDHRTEPMRHNLCHRSTKAYSQRINDEFDFAGGYEFHACSGATTGDLLPGNQDQNGPGGGNPPDHANEGELPQLKRLDEDTSLVTLSVGGNDVGFADVVESCLTRGLMEWKASCREAMGQKTRKSISDLEGDLVKLYTRIQREAPNARVLVVGYPRMFPENPIKTGPPFTEVGPSVELGDLDEPIDPRDQKRMNQMAQLLNETIKAAAQEAGVEYVEVYDAVDGHEIGTKASWINDLDLALENGGLNDMSSFHPNDRGQAAIARRVKKQIRNGGRPE